MYPHQCKIRTFYRSERGNAYWYELDGSSDKIKGSLKKAVAAFLSKYLPEDIYQVTENNGVFRVYYVD